MDIPLSGKAEATLDATRKVRKARNAGSITGIVALAAHGAAPLVEPDQGPSPPCSILLTGSGEGDRLRRRIAIQRVVFPFGCALDRARMGRREADAQVAACARRQREGAGAIRGRAGACHLLEVRRHAKPGFEGIQLLIARVFHRDRQWAGGLVYGSRREIQCRRLRALDLHDLVLVGSRDEEIARSIQSDAVCVRRCGHRRRRATSGRDLFYSALVQDKDVPCGIDGHSQLG